MTHDQTLFGRDEFSSLVSLRETMYLFLSRLFRAEIDSDFWPKIGPWLKVIDQFEGTENSAALEDMTAAGQAMRDVIDGWSEQDEPDILTEPAREYAALFLGVGPETVPLCESAYEGGTGTLFRNAYFRMKEVYRAAGLSKSDDFTEPDDHLAVELAYMARLVQKMSDIGSLDDRTVAEALEEQKGFLDNLLTWAPEVHQRIQNAAGAGFYQAVSLLMNGFLSLDRELIDHLSRSRDNQGAGSL
jgi:putative dimethyl sulfoxide reductase chaperone